MNSIDLTKQIKFRLPVKNLEKNKLFSVTTGKQGVQITNPTEQFTLPYFTYSDGNPNSTGW